MRRKSVRQILQVLDLTRINNSSGALIRRACQEAVREVAIKHALTYQTILDGCRRRLGFDQISYFHVQIQKWLNGNPQPLQERLMSKAGPDCHFDINQFFGGAGTTVSDDETDDDAGTETFRIDLPRAEALRLRRLCTLEEKPPSKRMFEIVTTNVERQLKPLLEEILKDPNTPYEQL